MRRIAPLVAVVALVAIGAAEGLESAREIADLPGRGRPPFAVGGATVTLIGLVLSVAVYVALGRYAARSTGDAVRLGAVVGTLAGLIGGTIRALLVRDYVDEVVTGFALPLAFATAALVVFVLLAVLLSAAGGASVTWLSFRSLPARSPRPRS